VPLSLASDLPIQYGETKACPRMSLDKSIRGQAKAGVSHYVFKKGKLKNLNIPFEAMIRI